MLVQLAVALQGDLLGASATKPGPSPPTTDCWASPPHTTPTLLRLDSWALPGARQILSPQPGQEGPSESTPWGSPACPC